RTESGGIDRPGGVSQELVAQTTDFAFPTLAMLRSRYGPSAGFRIGPRSRHDSARAEFAARSLAALLALGAAAVSLAQLPAGIGEIDDGGGAGSARGPGQGRIAGAAGGPGRTPEPRAVSQGVGRLWSPGSAAQGGQAKSR